MSDTYLSEIFPLTYCQLNLACFRLSPEIDRKIGNSFAWHFSKQFPDLVVIWEKEYFWILAKPNIKITQENNWQNALETIQEKLREKVGNRAYFIQWVNAPQATPSTIAQLAVRILKIHCRFTSPIVFNQNKVQVKRECNFWAETFTYKEQIKTAIALSIKSIFIYQETLEHFFDNHPYRNDPEQLLIDLLVRDIDSNSTATIVSINGTIGEHRERLLKQVTGSTSREKLQIAADNQPVISVRFGSNSHLYDYPMAALRPCITSRTAAKFNIESGELLKQTKLTYQERQQLLSQYKQEANKTLTDYGIKFKERCLNNKEYLNLFWQPETKLEDTLLLFGNGVTKPKNKTLRGLSEGGVYYRHREFQDFKRPIRLAILNFTSLKDKPFYDALESFLRTYKFPLILTRENIKQASLEELSSTEAKVKVETLVDEVIEVPIDLVLVFLPESDRVKDDRDGDSIYAWVYRRLLRRKLASQIIYEKTLREQYKYKYVFDQVVPGTHRSLTLLAVS